MSKHWKTIIAEIEAADSVEEVNRLDELSESKAVHKAAQERIRELTSTEDGNTNQAYFTELSATEENEVYEDVSEEIEAPSVEDNEPVAEKVAEAIEEDCPVKLTKSELNEYMDTLQGRINSISGVKKQLLKKIHRTLKAGLFALRDA